MTKQRHDPKYRAICVHCQARFAPPERGPISKWCPEHRYKGQRKCLTYEDRRARRLKERFKMTPEQWETLYQEQGGACAGCGREDDGSRKLAVDHNHKTGVVRGLLCFRCNTVVGKAGEDPAVLRTLAGYIERGGVG